MAEKTEEQLIQDEVKKKDRFVNAAEQAGLGPTPRKEPKPNLEADAGTPKSGWRKIIENVTKDILGK